MEVHFIAVLSLFAVIVGGYMNTTTNENFTI
jgi:hypothetical protein